MRRPGDSCFPPIAFDKGAMDGAPAGLWLRENNMLETVIGRSRRLSQALKRGVSAYLRVQKQRSGVVCPCLGGGTWSTMAGGSKASPGR
jgi:hypothetical protein